MDYLEQAKTLYRKRHIHAGALSANDHANLAQSITNLIRQGLTHQGGVSSFKYLPFISVIQRTVATNCFQGNRAAMAFTELEKYLLLLLGQPWKREFWLLKTYGGFFRTKVKAHLDNPEEILQLVGYMKEVQSSPSSNLILDHHPDAEVVLNVAFDCQVATEECLYIEEYYEKMKFVGLSLSEAMNVLLAGSSTDPLPPFPTAGLQTTSHNNSNVEVHPGLARQRRAVGDAMQLIGPPGAGLAAGTNSVHPGAGAPSGHPVPGLPVSHGVPAFYPVPQPVLHPPQQTADLHPLHLGQKAHMPQLHLPVGVGDAGFQQVPGVRTAYPSSAGAQSSGYGSGSASVVSNPSAAYGASSAFSATSGYPGTSHPYPSPAASVYNYGFPAGQAQSVGDQVDSPPVTGQLPHPVPPRHSRQLPFPHRPQADFPYIDDDGSDPSPVFPDPTHRQPLQESLSNAQGDPGRGKGGRTVPEVSRHQGMGSSEGASVAFNPVHRVQRDLKPVAVSGVGAIDGAGGVVAAPSSSIVRRSSQQSSDMTRHPPSQPATAVTAMLNVSSAMDGNKKMQGGDYVPHSIVGKPIGIRENQEPQSPPVHCPQNPNPLPFQRYSNPATGPVLQSQKPTFAQMAASGKPTNSQALLARQAQGSQSGVLSSQDKGQIAKSIINSGRSGSGSSSEVILREKMMKKGSLRGSSLVAPAHAGSGQDQGFSRQSSQSMDLGMLKWRCRTCTMENSAAETICSTCSKSRNAPDLQFPAAGESKRMCPACTYENPPGCSACEMCSTPLTDVHTYV